MTSRFVESDPRQAEFLDKDGKPVTNAFCPTGDGGGKDNSCAPKGGLGLDPAPKILDAASKLAGPNELVSFSQLREKLKLHKVEFDVAVLQMAKQGKVSLHKHDYPQGETETARKAMVYDPKYTEEFAGKEYKGAYYVGMSVRGDVQNAAPPKEPPPMPDGWTDDPRAEGDDEILDEIWKHLFGITKNYDPNQPRNPDGTWGSGGGSALIRGTDAAIDRAFRSLEAGNPNPEWQRGLFPEKRLTRAIGDFPSEHYQTMLNEGVTQVAARAMINDGPDDVEMWKLYMPLESDVQDDLAPWQKELRERHKDRLESDEPIGELGEIDYYNQTQYTTYDDSDDISSYRTHPVRIDYATDEIGRDLHRWAEYEAGELVDGGAWHLDQREAQREAQQWAQEREEPAPEESGDDEMNEGGGESPYTPEDVRRLIGLPKEAESRAHTSIDTDGMNGVVTQVTTFTEGQDDEAGRFEMNRTFHFDYMGNPEYIHNDLFTCQNRKTGLGAKAFAKQVHEAKKAGFEYIECTAARSGGQNGFIGYGVWPKFGYNADLPFYIRNKAKADGFEATTVRDLYKTKEGEKWWWEHGDTLDMKFDIQDEESMAILNAYVAKKGITVNLLRLLAQNAARYKFRTSKQRVSTFQKWLLAQMIKAGILKKNSKADPWAARYQKEAYERAHSKAFDQVNAPEQKMDFYKGTKAQFLRSAFGKPASRERVKKLAERTYDDLRDVTKEMSDQMAQVLAEGMLKGDSPRDVARDLADRVDKIGLTRATLIARTETIRAHAEGALDALERLGVEEVGVAVEWSTTEDDKVCPLCGALQGVVMTIKEARGLFPRHGNCRCSPIPANVGESTEGQARTKKDIESRFDESVELEGGEEKSSWQGADRTVRKVRPQSLIDSIKRDVRSRRVVEDDDEEDEEPTDNRSYFADCPRDEKGRCLPSGSGPQYASPKEMEISLKIAQKKIKTAPVPSRKDVEKARAELERSKNGGRPGGESRGGSASARRIQRLNMFKEFGGEEMGYVVCPWTGQKLHYTDDVIKNPNGYEKFERGKIFTKWQGGRYILPNLIPESFDANRARNDHRIRKENNA